MPFLFLVSAEPDSAGTRFAVLACVASDSKVEQVAKSFFGIRRFRAGQRELIRAVLDGKSAIGILPTGAGKSLCFQLPSLLLPGITLVISPLIALMQDQSEKLAERGVEAANLNSSRTENQSQAAMEDIEKGKSQLAYVTPERLEKPEYLEAFNNAQVTLVVIDEAHCISQWGHDFRPAYLSIREAIKKLGNPPVLALTATAAPAVVADIAKQLDLEDPLVIDRGIERPNLAFTVVPSVNDDIKRERLEALLRDTEGTGIIYTATVKAADSLRGFLLTRGINTGRYHGKLPLKEREKVQQAFMENRYKAMVATKAFGLGIDKPDVRFVVHYHFPDSIESYYQEAGRAGRDGKPAAATLLYRLEDRRIQSFFLGGKYPSKAETERVYRALVSHDREHPDQPLALAALSELAGVKERRLKVVTALFEQAGVLERGEAVRFRQALSVDGLDELLAEFEALRAADKERIEKMMHYAQSVQCRMRTMREYFGYDQGGECGQCDNCTVGKIAAQRLVS